MCSIKQWREDYTTQCPYYRKEGERTVVCEGTEDKNSVHLVFLTAARKGEYKKRYCGFRWVRCLIAKMLNRKYDYEP